MLEFGYVLELEIVSKSERVTLRLRECARYCYLLVEQVWVASRKMREKNNYKMQNLRTPRSVKLLDLS